MSKCPAFEELSRLVDGDLPGDQEHALRQHIEGCDTCRRQIDGIATLKRTVRRAGRADRRKPSPDLRQAVKRTLPKRRRRPPS